MGARLTTILDNLGDTDIEFLRRECPPQEEDSKILIFYFFLIINIAFNFRRRMVDYDSGKTGYTIVEHERWSRSNEGFEFEFTKKEGFFECYERFTNGEWRAFIAAERYFQECGQSTESRQANGRCSAFVNVSFLLYLRFLIKIWEVYFQTARKRSRFRYIFGFGQKNAG